jgi:uncharacterized protein (UPF0332 family)
VTEAEKIQALVGYRLEQAGEALAAARLTLANGLERSAVNRAYYAMFYAVLALLAARQSETSRHSGAIAQFDQVYIKPSLLPKELSRWLHDAFASRQAADYGSELRLSRQEIDDLLAHAREFVASVRQHLGADPAREGSGGA